MLIRGSKPALPKPKTVVFPREGGEDIVFICKVVLNWEEFDELCPVPKAPLVTQVNGPSYADTEDKRYRAKLMERSSRRVSWMLIQSLLGTPGLVYEKVDLKNPETWHLIDEELSEFLLDAEMTMLSNEVFELNIPSEERRKEALERFTSSQAEKEQESVSLQEEQGNTQSGGPANDSKSDRQE